MRHLEYCSRKITYCSKILFMVSCKLKVRYTTWPRSVKFFIDSATLLVVTLLRKGREQSHLCVLEDNINLEEKTYHRCSRFPLSC